MIFVTSRPPLLKPLLFCTCMTNITKIPWFCDYVCVIILGECEKFSIKTVFAHYQEAKDSLVRETTEK